MEALIRIKVKGKRKLDIFENLSMVRKRELIEKIRLKKMGQLDQDWDEMCTEFDLNVKRDTLRKAAVGIMLADEAGLLNFELEPVESAEKDEKINITAPLLGNITIPRELAELHSIKVPSEKIIPEEDAKGFMARQMVRDIRTKIREDLRAEARSRLLKEVVAEEISKLPKLPEIGFKLEKEQENEDGKTLVLCLGDFHYGAEYTLTGVTGETVYSYNPYVFETYMANLLIQLPSILLKEHVGRVEVMFVGDLLDGMLRQSQLMNLRYGIVESTIRLSEYLSNWLNALSTLVEEKVVVHAATGNHSEVRPLGSKARDYEDENMERIIMWYLSSRLQGNKKIEFDQNVSRKVYCEVEGYRFLILHGDSIGFKDINAIARDTVNLYSKPIDFFICGHLHNEATIQSGMTQDGHSLIIRVPSVCGIDEYAASKELGGDPGALALIIERDYGRRCMYPIKLKK